MRTLIISAITCLNYLPVNGIAQTNEVQNGWTEANLKGKVKSFEEADYDAKDHFGKIEKDGLQSKYVYKFDEQGNQIEWGYYNSDGILSSQYGFKYDEQGKRKEKRLDDSDGIFKNVYKYDEQGNQIEERGYDESGWEVSEYVFKYDEQGNQIEKRSTEIGIRSNMEIFRYVFKYDEQGNQIERSRYNSDGSLDYRYSDKYDYDKQGNWIKRVRFEDEILQTIAEREYEYYD